MPTRATQRRLLELHRKIKAGQCPSVPHLALDFECSEKTVCRDLDRLRHDSGAPLKFDSRRRSYVYTDPTFDLPAFLVTEGELLGLFLGTQLLRQYRGTDLCADLVRLFRKLADLLPDTVAIDFRTMNDAYAVTPAPADPVDVKILRHLLKAVDARLGIEMVYYTASRDLAQQRAIDPLAFHVVDGDCFLVAYCHLREAVRIFHPSRIQSLKFTGETFTPPPDFDLTRYLDEGFRAMRGHGPPQPVTLRFVPAMVRYVQNKTWHKTQTTKLQPDGALLVRFQMNDFLEVKRLALSFGPACEVLEPPALREEIRRDVEKMLDFYALR